MLQIYKIISYLIYPILPLLLFIRQTNGKEDSSRKLEKLGKTKAVRPKGKLIWIHCASVGEANAALALIKKILDENKDFNMLMTTGTLSSANLMSKKLPKRAIHQFNPLDTPQILKRFINHWKPDSVIWNESEIWPNTLTEIKKRNIPMVSVNSSISEKSFSKWQKRPIMIKEILSSFYTMLPQTDKQVKMLKKLGAKNVKRIGNLKLTTEVPIVDEIKLKELEEALGKRRRVCFSSTHKGEEEIAINIHKNIKSKVKGVLTIILPRHPSRKDEIKGLLEKTDFDFCFRSDGKLPTKNTDIYVADTFGEVGTFYKACPIVFMGGSMSPFHYGGHNPIEPANFGCAILTGNKISAFEEIFVLFKKASVIVKTEKSLEKNILDLLKNNKKREALSKEALKITGENNTILKDITAELKKAKVV